MRLIAGLSGCAVLVVLSVALDARGADRLPEGCRVEDGRFVCEDTYTVTDEPEDHRSHCEANPWLCMPSRPPAPPGSGGSTGRGDHTGPGRDGEAPDADTFANRLLRTMSCAQLADLEWEAKRDLSTDTSQESLETAEVYVAKEQLADARFSQTAMDALWDAKLKACNAYNLAKNARLTGEQVCRGGSGGKPERCDPPPASAEEAALGRACEDRTRALNERLVDQLNWQEHKHMAETNARARQAAIREDNRKLAEIRREMRRKKCPAPP